jgi:galactose-1-phosphate uridylyltransferase
MRVRLVGMEMFLRIFVGNQSPETLAEELKKASPAS